MTALSSRSRSAQLTQMFAPKSIALVGASDRSAWARVLVDNLEGNGFGGPIHLVNLRGETVFGRPSIRSLSELPDAPDLAYLLVRAEQTLPALKQAHLAGVKNFVVLGAGFGEAGETGRATEAAMADYCRENGLLVLGPNNMGFINFSANAVAFALPVSPPPPRGGVSIVSQSGALAFNLMRYMPTRSVGLDQILTVGNEAVVDVSECIDYLVDAPTTRVICLYIHAIRHPDRFAEACERAAIAGKPVIVFKVGSGEQSARAAVAHTGGLVGDDQVIDAVLRQVAAIRTASVDDLVATAALFDGYGELTGVRPGIVAGAGSSCEMFSDRADRLGFEIPMIGDATQQRLREAGLPDFATAQNPLDVTGAVTIDAAGTLPAIEKILIDDPAVDVLILQGVGIATPYGMTRADAIAFRSLQDSVSKPVLAFGDLPTNAVADYFAFRDEFGTPPVIESIDRGVAALQAMGDWTRRRTRLLGRSTATGVPAIPDVAPASHPGEWSEATARDYLVGFGVPVVAGGLARSSAEAIELANGLGYPVVVKICSPQILHKTEIGGVVLGVGDEEQLLRAFDDVMARAASAQPTAELEGVLVSPMRPPGVELLVGVSNDPQWGPILAVGLGGVWVDTLKDVALRRLPVERDEVLEMLSSRAGSALLDGARGSEPVDREAVADAVLALADAAWSLRDTLLTLEINPLVARGAQVEALDALVEFARS